MAKKNKKHEDDFTIANMNVDGMPDYVDEEQQQKIEEMRGLNLTKAEKRAIFWGGFMAVFPLIFFIIAGFGVAILFCWWWLG